MLKLKNDKFWECETIINANVHLTGGCKSRITILEAVNLWQCTHIGMCDTCVMCALDTVEHVHSHSKMHCNALSCRCTSITGQSGKVRGGDIVRHGHLRLEISKIAFESCKCVMCIHIVYIPNICSWAQYTGLPPSQPCCSIEEVHAVCTVYYI